MNRANTILEIKESLKKLFSTNEVKFAEMELLDGSKIVTDSDQLGVGVNVFGLDEQGNQIALDNGDVVLADGRTITIENGAVKAIIEAEHTEESPVSEGEIEAAEVIVEEKGPEAPASEASPIEERMSILEGQMAECLGMIQEMAKSQGQMKQEMSSEIRKFSEEPGEESIKSNKKVFDGYDSKKISVKRNASEIEEIRNLINENRKGSNNY